MKIIINSPKIFDPQSKWHLKIANVVIENGIITNITKDKVNGDLEIEGKNAWLSVGWFDTWAYVGEPGHENKETLRSVRRAASAGGFTAVGVLPNNHPVTQTKNDVNYFLNSNLNEVTALLPYGAVSKDLLGENITEMIDLRYAGAIAFTDGNQSIGSSELVSKTLQYLQTTGTLLIQKPEDKNLNNNGGMHEGVVSTKLGLPGIPAVAEEIIIQRDLSILEYAGGSMHFSNISSAGSVSLIRRAKKKGLNVTCSIASYQTAFSDEDLVAFDTNYKVSPPFRSKKDAKAIVKGLLDGTIDVINSNHLPQDPECKQLEFDLADFGITSLQTVASDLARLSKDVPMETLLEKVTVTPRKMMGIEVPSIEKGKKMELTLFNPEEKWELNAKTNKSKSVNSPFFNSKLTGKVKFVGRNEQYYYE